MSSSTSIEDSWIRPVPDQRRNVYRFYKLTFGPDGCPMKRMPEGDVFHPILGAYLIYEYATWYEKSGDPQYLRHATEVARLALARAEEFRGASVFWYRPETKLSSIPHTFYSALTQAWYVHALAELSKYVGEEFGGAIANVYRSLTIPVDQGGCFIDKGWGWIVEEYPNDPPLYTLNGWLTVVMMVAGCKVALERLGLKPREFVRRNLAALQRLLPLYDAEFIGNSRYQLTGATRVRMIFDREGERELRELTVEVPGEGIYKAGDRKPARWGNYLERREGRLLQFNILMSLASYPQPNILTAQFTLNQPCKVRVQLATGKYRPDLSGMTTEGWRDIGRVDLSSSSPSLRIELPWDEENLFAYPTNFKKKIENKFFNAYHYIHITDLAWMYAISGNELFKQYALKFLGYVDRWPDIPALAMPGISFDPQSTDRVGIEAIVWKILEKRTERV